MVPEPKNLTVVSCASAEPAVKRKVAIATKTVLVLIEFKMSLRLSAS